MEKSKRKTKTRKPIQIKKVFEEHVPVKETGRRGVGVRPEWAPVKLYVVAPLACLLLRTTSCPMPKHALSMSLSVWSAGGPVDALAITKRKMLTDAVEIANVSFKIGLEVWSASGLAVAPAVK